MDEKNPNTYLEMSSGVLEIDGHVSLKIKVPLNREVPPKTKHISNGDADGAKVPSDNTEPSSSQQRSGTDDGKLLYSVDDIPPWYLCIALGFQHFLTAVGGIISGPLIVHRAVCMEGDNLGLSELMGTMFFVCGLSSMLQSSIGVRLPIIQGATAAFFMPIFALMSQPEWECPYTNADNETLASLPALGSDGHKLIWQSRLQVVSGSLMVASVFQVLLGSTGLAGFILRFIGPLSICPTVLLIGLSLAGVVAEFASSLWYIAVLVTFFVALFSQYLKNIRIPFCKYIRGKGCSIHWTPFFQLFPVILAIGCGWIICSILTASGALTSDSEGWGYKARTDIKLSVLSDAQWFKFPYPAQFGSPIVNVAGVVGMMAGVIASVIESIGDYHACARLSGAPNPPIHAVNRGIIVEGFGCFICGLWGAGNGTTSYSENIGAIALTRVGSRRVVFVGGFIMCILGCLGKFTALFVAIPDPVIGGGLLCSLGMVCAVGLSNLQFVDMGSSRNLFIVGISVFFGLLFPNWINEHLDAINTGSMLADQVITVLLSTHMFIGGFVGFVLDNTIPGTDEERGIAAWKRDKTGNDEDKKDVDCERKQSPYDLPYVQKYLNKWEWPKWIPFCPSFNPDCSCRRITSDSYNMEATCNSNDKS